MSYLDTATFVHGNEMIIGRNRNEGRTKTTQQQQHIAHSHTPTHTQKEVHHDAGMTFWLVRWKIDPLISIYLYHFTVSTLERGVDVKNHTTVSKCRTPYLEKKQQNRYFTKHTTTTVLWPFSFHREKRTWLVGRRSDSKTFRSNLYTWFFAAG